MKLYRSWLGLTKQTATPHKKNTVTHADGNPGPDLGQAQNKLITFNHLEKNWRLQTTKGLWFIIGARECSQIFFNYNFLRINLFHIWVDHFQL
jgi:hypothetical protein